ncbi:MAG: M20/M25/M40 family metallo-hydrolase [Actinobacteria bacterium]|nr:M20/M25/M40 family metallo-hydrolase [Actinomycetota bacterium]
MGSSRKAPVFLLLLAALLLTLAVVAPLAAADNNKPLAPNAVGEKAYWYVDQLTRVDNGDGTYTGLRRQAGTPGEVAAAEKIAAWFGAAGYQPTMQPFTYVRGGTTYASQNVVAWRPADLKRRGEPTPLVIVGAHYDAVTAGQGADDNASGVGVMLEVAERLAHFKIDYDIVFVAFGAEEVGLRGSTYFANQLSAADVQRAICMVNFDSLLVGDKLYIHAGANGKTWARDAMLRLIRLHKLPIEIQPGLYLVEHPGADPGYAAGFTPDGFSDYTAFNRAGIPVAAFESTNWEIGDLDGYTQTEEYGSFWHTPSDTIAAIEARYPERPMERLHAFTTVVFEFLKHLNPMQVTVQ